MSTTASEPQTPKLINDRYRVLQLLGKGGMGQVLLVEDTHRGRTRMALKTLLPDTTDELLTSGFRDEFAELAKLEHPHLARAFDFGKIAESGEYFFTTEFIRGEELSRVARTSSTQALIELTVQILRALDFIHGHGILHNDLKPANLLVAKERNSGRAPSGRDLGRLEALVYGNVGTVKLIDFGLISREHTAWNKILGTLRYISPERIRREPADRRSDLYSAGIVLYALFARRPPFDSRDTHVLLKHHLETLPAPLAALRPDLPEALVRLVHRLLEKKPDDRFASAGEALHFLSEELGDAIGAAPRSEKSQADRLSPGSLLYRARELETLSAAYMAAAGGKRGRRALIVTGPHGTGKTRLVEELRARIQVDGGLFVRVECQCGDTTLRPVIDELLRVLSTSGHTERKEIEERLDSASKERGDVADLLEKELLRLSGSIPVLFTLDDFHAASQPVRQFAFELLDAVESNAEGAPHTSRMLVVLTRDSESKRNAVGVSGLSEIKLAGFDAEESAGFVREIFGQSEVPQAVIDRLVKASEGNPLFLIELARALVQSGAASLAGASWTFPVEITTVSLPHSLDQLITGRIQALTPPQRDLLEWIAAARRSLPVAVLERCSGALARKVRAEIAALASKNLIESLPDEEGNEHVRLVHAGSGDAVLQRQDPERRRFLHQRIAQNLQATYPDRSDLEDILAEHWLLAGNETGFLRFAPGAAEILRRRGDYATAASYHERIAASVPETQLQKRVQSLARLADMHEFLWNLDSCAERLEQIHALAKGLMKPADRALVLRRLAGVEVARHRPKVALERLDEASASIGDSAPALRLAIDATRPLALFFSGRASDASRLLIELRSAFESNQDGSDGRQRLLRIGALNQMASAHSLLGDLDAAIALFEENLRALENADQPQALGATHCALGSVLLDRGDWVRASKHLTEAQRIGKEIGDRRTVCRARERLGEEHLRFGRFREALRTTEVGLEDARALGNETAVVNALRTLSRIHLAADDLAAAKRTLRRALDSSSASDPVSAALCRLTLAECHLEVGDVPAARAELESIAEDPVAHASPLVEAGRLRLEIVALWRVDGRFDVKATDLLEDLIDRHRLRGELVDWLLARARIEAEAGDQVATGESLRRLGGATGGFDTPPVRADAALVRARIHLARGEMDAARSLLRRLHDLARHRGNYRLARIAATMFDAETSPSR